MDPFRRLSSVLFAIVVLASTSAIAPALAAPEASLIAQAGSATTGTVTGVATDAAGVVVTGVAVTLSGPATYHAVSGEDGTYVLAGIKPGVYAIKATKSGYQTATQEQVVVTAGAATNLSVQLSQPTLTSVQTIGRTGTTSSGSHFNPTAAAVSQISQATFSDQGQRQVQKILDQTPGIVIDHPGTSANNASPGAITFPSIRGGLGFETSSLIDGHALAVGSFGDYVTTFLNSDLLQDVELVKGPGANLTQINYALNGAVNFRTLSVPTGPVVQLKQGWDGYGGHFSNFKLGDSLFNNKIQFIVDYAVNGTPGPLNNVPNYLFVPTSTATASKTNFGSYFVTVNGQPVTSPYAGAAASGTNGIQNPPASLTGTAVAYGYPVNTTFTNKNELGKLKLNFSDETSLTLSYLGSQTYTDQNGNHLYAFNTTLSGPAFNTTGPNGQLLFPGQSVQTWQNLGGSGQLVPSYYEINNEPIFQGEFRTTIKNDTILARAYAAAILRLQYGGETGYSSPQSITLPVYGTLTTGTGAAAHTQTYTGQPLTFTYSPNPNNGVCGALGSAVASGASLNGGPVCGSAANPYSGYVSQTFNPADEEDHILGETFEYDHPFGPSLGDTATLGYDQIISNTINRDFPGSYQAPGIPQGSYEIYRTYLGRVQFGLGSKVNVTIANYLNFHTYNFATNQSVLALGSCPVPLTAVVCTAGFEFMNNPNPNFQQTQLWHDDPRASVTIRAARDTSFRLSAGSSIVPPYLNLLSRTQTAYSPVTVGANITNYANTIPNTNLRPETAFSYDGGLDQRLFDGQSILSMDLYYTDLYNQFYNYNFISGCSNGTAASGINANGTCIGGAGYVPVISSQYVNLSNARYQGIEFALSRDPRAGWGYTVQGALQRAFVYNLPPCFYATNITCTGYGTNLNVITGRNYTGTAPGLGGTNSIDNHSIPYSQGYGEVHYRTPKGIYVSAGLQYYGNNNSLYLAAFLTGNASVIVPIPTPVFRTTLHATVQNIGPGSYANQAYVSEYAGEQYSLINGNNALTSANPIGPTTYNVWIQFDH